MRLVPSGLENPRVVSEEPLISKAFWTVRLPVPQNTKVKATTMRSIHISGRLTRETGAYSARSALARASVAPPVHEEAVHQSEVGLGKAGEASLGQDHGLERRAQDAEHDGGAKEQGEDAEGDHGSVGAPVWWAAAGTLPGHARGEVGPDRRRRLRSTRAAVGHERDFAASCTARSTSFLSICSSLATCFCALSAAFST